jgi:hypothetical protein
MAALAFELGLGSSTSAAAATPPVERKAKAVFGLRYCFGYNPEGPLPANQTRFDR